MKFQSFNVEGLNSKLKDETFIDSIKKFDFITLVETWLPANPSINIEVYYCYNRSRTKSKQARRYSGGIRVWVKKTLRKGVSFFSSKSNELVWWKLDKMFFNMEEDIYVCSVYIPSSNSKYFGKIEKDPYDELQAQILHYSRLSKIILMGDFNARKGSLSDSTENGLLNDFQLTGDSDQTDIHLGNEKFGKLHSLDQITNKYDRSLINICFSNGLSILNGRTMGNLLGRYTCYKPNGASVLDYAIASNGLMKFVTYVSVLPLNFYSCHCPIAFALKTKTFSVDKNYSDFLQPQPDYFIWNTEKKSLYKSLLSEKPVLSEGKAILNKMTQDKLSYESIDTAVDSITKCCIRLQQNALPSRNKELKIGKQTT